MIFKSRHLSFAAFTVLVTVVMSGTLRPLIAYALNGKNTHASQIVLIPFISAALIYLNRKNVFRDIHYSVTPALLVFLLGVGLFICGKAVGAGLEKGDYLSLMTS